MIPSSHIKDLFICLLVICLLVLGIYHLKAKDELSKANDSIVCQLLKNDTLRHTINDLNQTVDIQSQNIFETDDKIEAMLRINSTLSRVNSQLKVTTLASSDTLTARYVYPAIEKVHDTSFVAVDTKFRFKNKWLNLYGVIGKQGVIIDTLSVVNTITINIGEKRHLFSKNEQDIEVVNDNPYFKTISMKNIILTDKGKWYNSRLLYFGTGIIGGIILADRLH